MSSLYPPIEPYDHGLLDVGDGQRLYWEECGNPAGQTGRRPPRRPGFGLHAGHAPLLRSRRLPCRPLRPAWRRPQHAPRQRTDYDLSVNTTEHLLADIERLRIHLGIDRWLVYGGSWGATLALAYAERHPDRVTGIVLLAVTMTRRSEIHWLYHDVGRFFPEQWFRFRAAVPEADRDGDLVAAYYRLMNSPDLVVREQAARDWCDWESALVSADPDAPPLPRWSDPKFRMGYARIVTHYFHHGAWLEEGQLLRDAGRLAGIPGALVHGRLDLGGPLMTAWELHRAWPGSELLVVNEAGHSSGDPGMAETAIAALDRFRP